MRRLARHAFTALSALSLLLCVAVCVLWVRSHVVVDDLLWRSLRPDERCLNERHLSLRSSGGGFRIAVQWGTMPRPDHLGIDPSEYGPVGFVRFTDKSMEYPPAHMQSAAATFAGFGVERGDYPPGGWPDGLHLQWIGLILPYWFMVLALGPIPLLWLMRVRRAARARAAGLCPACGFDLRASPDRCPECGAAAPVAAAVSSVKQGAAP
jgi:hypothetical protein